MAITNIQPNNDGSMILAWDDKKKRMKMVA